ncbi:MAG TPA: hypothetical protein VF407_02795 [Polyangiaceae bacterium]
MNTQSQTSRNDNKRSDKSTATSSDGQSSGGYGMDDLSYDLVTVLHEKSKGLEAFERYLGDAEGNEEVRSMLERMQENDRKCVAELRDRLAKVLGGAQSQGQGQSQSAE